MGEQREALTEESAGDDDDDGGAVTGDGVLGLGDRRRWNHYLPLF